MVFITWIIITLGFFVDTVAPQGKKQLECYECTHDEKCATTHEPGEVMKCSRKFEDLLKKVQNNTNGIFDGEIKELFEQFGGGAGGIFPFGPNAGGGGGFNPLGPGGGGLNPLGPGGGGNIDWSKNPFFHRRSSTDNSTDGSEEGSDAASRQFNNLLQPTWFCGRKEKGGNVTRFCSKQQPGVSVGNTCPPDTEEGVKCSFCNTDKCNGSTQLGQMSTWGVIILSAFLTLIPPSLL